MNSEFIKLTTPDGFLIVSRGTIERVTQTHVVLTSLTGVSNEERSTFPPLITASVVAISGADVLAASLLGSEGATDE